MKRIEIDILYQVSIDGEEYGTYESLEEATKGAEECADLNGLSFADVEKSWDSRND